MELSGIGSYYNQYASISNATSGNQALESAKNIDPKSATDEELLDACKQFEQYFVEQVIKEAKKTIPDDSLLGDNEYVDMFEDNMVQQLAQSVTDSGQLGFAQKLYESMSQQAGHKIEKQNGEA